MCAEWGEGGSAGEAVGPAVVEGLHMGTWAVGGHSRAALGKPQKVLVARYIMCVFIHAYIYIHRYIHTYIYICKEQVDIYLATGERV